MITSLSWSQYFFLTLCLALPCVNCLLYVSPEKKCQPKYALWRRKKKSRNNKLHWNIKSHNGRHMLFSKHPFMNLFALLKQMCTNSSIYLFMYVSYLSVSRWSSQTMTKVWLIVRKMLYISSWLDIGTHPHKKKGKKLIGYWYSFELPWQRAALYTQTCHTFFLSFILSSDWHVGLSERW